MGDEDEMDGGCWRALRMSTEAVGRTLIGSSHSKIRVSSFNGGVKSQISSIVWKSLNALSTKAMPSITGTGPKAWKPSWKAGIFNLYSKAVSSILHCYIWRQIQPIPFTLCRGKLCFKVKLNLWLPVQTPCDQYFNILPSISLI
jgi:hypothetical protein